MTIAANKHVTTVSTHNNDLHTLTWALSPWVSLFLYSWLGFGALFLAFLTGILGAPGFFAGGGGGGLSFLVTDLIVCANAG